MIAAVAASSVMFAGDIDGSAVLGSMVGAGVGSAVGSSIGGKNGAIIGGGAGGALGAAVGSTERRSTTVVHERVIYDDRHHDNGKHRGHRKHHRGHDRD